MPNEMLALPTIGSKAFWVLYDQFCSRDELKKLSNGEQTDLCLRLQQILRTSHDLIVELGRPENGWGYPKAWLVLRYEMVLNNEGHVFMHLTSGDVMVREFCWDRDVLITHSPITERMSGQLLHQGWPNAQKGLFFPLYTKETIMRAIKIKLKKNMANALTKAEEESRDWRWY